MLIKKFITKNVLQMKIWFGIHFCTPFSHKTVEYLMTILVFPKSWLYKKPPDIRESLVYITEGKFYAVNENHWMRAET